MFILLLILNFLILTISIWNFFSAPRFKNILNTSNNFNSTDKENKFVSILIPARNEGENIEKCLNSVLNLNYLNYEIIVLDDNSEDSTLEILNKIKQNHINASKLKILNGSQLPSGWLGKNWACHQLAIEASGEILLFIDADVELNHGMIQSVLNEFEDSSLQAFSVFPTQRMPTFGEKVIIPTVNLLLVQFLPINQVYHSKNTAFLAANGAFFVFRKDFYNKYKFHQLVKSNICEDMAIGRIIKQKGYKFKTLLDDGLVNIRMYKSLFEGIKGFSKNMYVGSGLNNPLIFLLINFIVIIPILLPYFLIILNPDYIYILLIIIIGRIFSSLASKQPVLTNILLLPVHLFVILFISINSVYVTLTGKAEWKGRTI